MIDHNDEGLRFKVWRIKRFGTAEKAAEAFGVTRRTIVRMDSTYTFTRMQTLACEALSRSNRHWEFPYITPEDIKMLDDYSRGV